MAEAFNMRARRAEASKETKQADGLTYAGSAFVTLPQDERDTFWKATELLKVKTPAVRSINGAKASFLKPLLRVRMKHLKSGEMLCHGSLVELVS